MSNSIVKLTQSFEKITRSEVTLIERQITVAMITGNQGDIARECCSYRLHDEDIWMRLSTKRAGRNPQVFQFPRWIAPSAYDFTKGELKKWWRLATT